MDTSKYATGKMVVHESGLTAHTEGPKSFVSVCQGYAQHAPALNRANMERIAACWNACEGINPEAVPMMLEALKNIFGSMDLYRACGQVYPPKVEALMVAIGAAIAKAEGQK